MFSCVCCLQCEDEIQCENQQRSVIDNKVECDADADDIMMVVLSDSYSSNFFHTVLLQL